MKAVDSAMDEIEREQKDVSAETCIPHWDGEPMDDDMVVESLYQLQRI